MPKENINAPESLQNFKSTSASPKPSHPETEIERNLRISRMLREGRNMSQMDSLINENRKLRAELMRQKAE